MSAIKAAAGLSLGEYTALHLAGAAHGQGTQVAQQRARGGAGAERGQQGLEIPRAVLLVTEHRPGHAEGPEHGEGEAGQRRVVRPAVERAQSGPVEDDVVDWLQEAFPQRLFINPLDAAARGIADGVAAQRLADAAARSLERNAPEHLK